MAEEGSFTRHAKPLSNGVILGSLANFTVERVKPTVSGQLTPGKILFFSFSFGISKFLLPRRIQSRNTREIRRFSLHIITDHPG